MEFLRRRCHYQRGGVTLTKEVNQEMKTLVGKLVSVQSGNNADLSKQSRYCVRFELDGIAGDKHQGYSRLTHSGEREPKGTVVRNERHWSGVSVEELAVISQKMDLSEALSAETLGANICVEGIPDFSLLPKGSRLSFPSGAALLVEEYNPPCVYMGAQIAEKYTSNSGEPLDRKQFVKPAAGRRGVVGTVDVAGDIKAGDQVTVTVFEAPVIRMF